MGPHKTATTTIQAEALANVNKLRRDGYEVLEHEHLSQKGFRACFVGFGSCDQDLLLRGSQFAQQNRNIFVSSEGFAFIDRDGLTKLQTYLSQWDETIIVVAYRRYYSWLGSIFNQFHKNHIFAKSVHGPGASMYDVRPGMDYLHWLENHIFNNGPASNMYTAALFERLTTQFSRDQIFIINMHDNSITPDEALYCHAMPDAARTCSAIKVGSVHRNSHSDTVYGDMVYGAYRAGLINSHNVDEKVAMIAAKRHQNEILNLSDDDFPRKCLSEDAKKALLQKSLEYEKALFPEAFQEMEKDLRSDFEEAVGTYLCEYDIESILANGGWKELFRSLDDAAHATE
jgi:hypothetical protein